MKQNSVDEVEFLQIIFAEEAVDSIMSPIIEPAMRLKRGYEHLRGTREFDDKRS